MTTLNFVSTIGSFSIGFYLGPVLAKRFRDADCKIKLFICPHCLAFWISFLTGLVLFTISHNLMDYRKYDVYFILQAFVNSLILYFIVRSEHKKGKL
jgi:hypothetical protein